MIYWLFRSIIILMSYVPISVGRYMGRILGNSIAVLPLQRNAISLDNIQQSFGGSMGSAEIRRLYYRVFSHFGQMFFEIPHILRLNQNNIDRYVSFEGEDHLLQALKKGKGVFMFTGHFGNWELMLAAGALRFGPTAVVVRPADFPPIDRVIKELRTRFGTEVIPKQGGMKRILSSLRENKIVGILLDQNVDWYMGVFVNFLGRWACVNKGLALMALRMQTPVIPVFSVRRKDGRYSVIFGKCVELVRTGDNTRDVEENTALFTDTIEKQIREHPDHWFWFHRRWKTRPYCPLPDLKDVWDPLGHNV